MTEGTAASLLAAVTAGEPAAVLLVDLADRTITYANDVAFRLLGEALPLPVGVDEWARRFPLHDIDGRPIPAGCSAAVRLAEGETIPGEAVVLVSGEERRSLWVTGLPLGSQPAGHQVGLLAFFDVHPV